MKKIIMDTATKDFIETHRFTEEEVQKAIHDIAYDKQISMELGIKPTSISIIEMLKTNQLMKESEELLTKEDNEEPDYSIGETYRVNASYKTEYGNTTSITCVIPLSYTKELEKQGYTVEVVGPEELPCNVVNEEYSDYFSRDWAGHSNWE